MYQIDSSLLNYDNTHVVPDRQQYDRHTPILSFFFFLLQTYVIISGLDSLGLVSLTNEALLSAMTWLAVHKTRPQLSEQIRKSDGMMHSGFESRKVVPRNDE